MNKKVGTFVTIGFVFLLAGLVQQGFAFNFESGMFNLGLIFVVSGLVAMAIERRTTVAK